MRVIAHILGVPEQDGDLFRRWIKEILEIGVSNPQILMGAQDEMCGYFADKIAARRSSPREDLVGYLVNARIEDRPLAEEHINGTLRLLLIAGIDTTWSAIGSCLWHLAQHAGDRQRLNAKPEPNDVSDRGISAAPTRPSPWRAKSSRRRKSLADTQARAHGFALISGGKPGSCNVPECRSGRHRPHTKPPRRLRPRHPSMRWLQSGPHGNKGSADGVARAHSRILSRPKCAGDVVQRHCTRTEDAAAADRLIAAC